MSTQEIRHYNSFVSLKMTHRRYPENDKGCLSGPKKRVVQTVVHLSLFTMESRIPMVLIQLDTVGSLGFLRGIQLSLGTPNSCVSF
jgi:hypothetical protein